MVERILFLALLVVFLASPRAMAEEIGGGSPDSSADENSTNQATPVESETSHEDCFTETLLKFFFGDI